MVQDRAMTASPSWSNPGARYLPRRTVARLHAYQALEDIQTHDRRPVLEDAIRMARREHWSEVECVLHHARFAEALSAKQDAREAALNMLESAERSGSDALLAAALACLSIVAFDDDPVAAINDRDLPRATALLQDTDIDPVDAPMAMIACSIAYCYRGLWDPALEQMERASQTLEHPTEPALEPIARLCRRALATNYVAVLVPTVANLLELDRRSEAIEIADRTPDLLDMLDPDTPQTWHVQMLAVDELMAAVRGLPPRRDPAELRGQVRPPQSHAVQVALALAAAVRALDDGRPHEAATHVDVVLHLVDDDVAASLRPLILRWTALGDPPAPRWRDYAEESTRLRWYAHHTTIEGARAQVAAERVLLEHERLSMRAYVDELTGLANRHAYARHLTRLRAGSAAEGLAALLIDVDRFKVVNDTFGHVVGDDVLRTLGALLTQITRATDLAVRLGGDEFLLLLAGPSVREVSDLGRDLWRRVREHTWSDLAPGLGVTVSVGAATGSIARVEELIAIADDQLYLAKTRGRDQVAVR